MTCHNSVLSIALLQLKFQFYFIVSITKKKKVNLRNDILTFLVKCFDDELRIPPQ